MTKAPIYYTNTTPIMTWCSYKIKPRKERATNNIAPLILQVFINGRKTVIDLQIQVDITQWDAVRQEIKGKTDHIRAQNSLIAEIKAYIIIIQQQYRLQNKVLTTAEFKDTFLNRSSRQCFIQFFATELEARYKSGEIQHSTYRAQKNVLTRLQIHMPTLSFSEISHATLQQIQLYLHKHFTQLDHQLGQAQGYHTNTIHNHFKTIKTYMLLAQRKGIKFQYPFEHFKMQRGSGRIIYLNQYELNKLLHAWRNNVFHGTQHYSLCVFLFSCYTSLRISDIKALRHTDILQDHIVIRPQKTHRTGKVVRIPLNTISKELIQGREGQIFNAITEQKINIHLKSIAAMLGIDKRLSMHVGRHTFATEFLRRGGQIHVLQKLMGHNDIKTTMVYSHLDDQHIVQQMSIMDE